MTLSSKLQRKKFDQVYDDLVIDAGFCEFPDYYGVARERYWRSLELLVKMGLSETDKVVEFGGGQMAIILSKLFGMDCTVADINDSFRGPVDQAGLPFVVGNIANDPPIENSPTKYDMVILLEVIEHIPEPPYVTMRKLKSILSAKGGLFMTTPNLFRLRNTARMILGRDFLGRFMQAEPGVGLGHQMEYSLEHMSWQINNAGFEIDSICHDQLGVVGHSTSARIARALLSPLQLRDVWKEELVAMARLPG